MRKFLLFAIALVMCACNSSDGKLPFVGAWQMDVTNCHYVYEFTNDGGYSCTMTVNDVCAVEYGRYRIEQAASCGSYYLCIYDRTTDGQPLSGELQAVAKAKGNTLHLMFMDQDGFLVLKR